MIEDKNFGEDLIHEIEEKKIQPTAKWFFLLKNYGIWALGVISLISGAIATSLIIYMLTNNDLDIYNRTGEQLLKKLLIILPLFWLVCLGLFVILVLFNIKHTKKGYRYPWPGLLAIVIIASIILGEIFYATGLGKIFDNFIGRHAPFYDQIINPHIDFWSQPEEGRLVGIIISVINQDSLNLIDRDSKEWEVDISQAKWSPGVIVETGRPARFIGIITEPDEFQASEILPMIPGRGFFNRFGPRPEANDPGFPPPPGFEPRNMMNN